MNPPHDRSSPHVRAVDSPGGPINGCTPPPAASSWANGYGRSAHGSGRCTASPWQTWPPTSGPGKNLAPESPVFAVFGAEVIIGDVSNEKSRLRHSQRPVRGKTTSPAIPPPSLDLIPSYSAVAAGNRRRGVAQFSRNELAQDPVVARKHLPSCLSSWTRTNYRAPPVGPLLSCRRRGP